MITFLGQETLSTHISWPRNVIMSHFLAKKCYQPVGSVITFLRREIVTPITDIRPTCQAPGLVSAGVIQEFRAICKKHTKESPYPPPLERGPGSHPNRWKPGCFVIRDLLRNPVFWQGVYELLPKQADGLEVTSVTPQRRSVQQEPQQFYLRELRRLALQTSRA